MLKIEYYFSLKNNIEMDQSKRVEIALSILGWDSSKYKLSMNNKTLKEDLTNEMIQKMISVSTGEGNPILRNDQWAYGVLLSLDSEIEGKMG